MEECQIYVVAHKKFHCPEGKLYLPIQVGNGQDLPYKCLRDNVGENISEKNGTYCELTALYWIWKNVTHIKYVGICHYRRYFSTSVLSNSPKFFLKEKEILRILSDYDIILPKKINVRENIRTFYYKYGKGREKDLFTLDRIIKNNFSDYYNTYKNVMSQKSGYYCNMMIISKERYDDYCRWLFQILFELERKINLTGYSKEEKRVFGYISEILLNVWVNENQLKIKEYPIANTELNLKKRIRRSLSNKAYAIMNVIQSCKRKK